MAKTGSKSRPARKPVRKPRKRAAARKSDEKDAYTQSLIAHGQAVRVPAGKKLPAGATHELVEGEDGSVRAVRRRFSLL